MLNIYLKLLEKVVVHNQGSCHPQRTSDDIWDIFVCHNRGRGGGRADAAGTQCAEVSDGVNILQCIRQPPQKGIIHPNVNNVKVVKSLHIYGLPRWHNGKKKKNPPAMYETQETWIRSLGREDSLENMATHSSILAWEIPWTEEPGRLHGVKRVHTHIHIHRRIYHMNIKKLTGTFLYFGLLSFLNIMPRHRSS